MMIKRRLHPRETLKGRKTSPLVIFARCPNCRVLDEKRVHFDLFRLDVPKHEGLTPGDSSHNVIRSPELLGQVTRAVVNICFHADHNTCLTNTHTHSLLLCSVMPACLHELTHALETFVWASILKKKKGSLHDTFSW